MKRFFLLSVTLIFLVGCFFRSEKAEKESKALQQREESVSVVTQKNLQPHFTDSEGKTSSGNSGRLAKDQELLRFARYLEQADSVHREAWWVVTADRKANGKTIFGKVQRALWQELKIKLANKSLFRCDNYQLNRQISSPTGLPQKGEIYENCQKSPVLLAEYSLAQGTQANIVFHSQGLGELLGLGTSILNHKITCDLNGDREGKLITMSCRNFVQDRNEQQDLRFTNYEYNRDGNILLDLKGQVFESLYPVRKFEASVPASGKIQVVETQTQAPEPEPVVILPPSNEPIAPKQEPLPQGNPQQQVMPADPDSLRRRHLETGAPLEMPPSMHPPGEQAPASERQGDPDRKTPVEQPGVVFGEERIYNPNQPETEPVDSPSPPPGVRGGSEDSPSAPVQHYGR